MDHPDRRTGPRTASALETADFLALDHAPLHSPAGGGASITRARLDALEVYALHAQGACAIVSRFGAQVLAYRTAAGREVLFTSALAPFDRSRPIRGGIPVCWPWFGPAAQPQHGWGRIRDWELAAADADAGAAGLTLRLAEPGGASAQVRIELGSELWVALTHLGDPAAGPPVTAALHSYLRTPEAGATRVRGLPAGTQIPAAARNAAEPGAFAFPAAGIDAALALPGGIQDIRLAVAAGERDCATIAAACSDVVLWNPGGPLGDTTEHAHRGFVCVEPARLGQPLRPGEELAAAYSA